MFLRKNDVLRKFFTPSSRYFKFGGKLKYLCSDKDRFPFF
ncbi:hypothetical protein LEP1GSC168_2511 [Leptospira santarosai str. HAI134]|nr:hypothetical protein LEP1GSC163_3502 [Leptospira santarosai str. CBC379]EMJ47907.1 hypothetical protein LEP1GSC169_2904 [Leptospira santarosai str. HAI1349]EMM77257.1 hypothetical protein LEP1GSC040_2795 [Leptospira santarosai str. 2000030832]EMO22334.1 hypothetical protein LEP1GSC168_2511 [Leptospira santarosai str. HAI134]